MILLDTHAWLWWVLGDELLSRDALKAIDRDPDRGVSAVSCFEIARLAARGRIQLDRTVTTWLDAALTQPGVMMLPVSLGIGVRAANLLDPFPGDPIDRIIAATALEHRCPLVTKDERIAAHPGIKTIW